MAQIADSWLRQQFERLSQTRPDMVGAVLQRALEEDADFRWAMVVGAYLDEQINLGKAAELLGMHRAQLQQLFLERGIPVRLGAQTLEEARAEAECMGDLDARGQPITIPFNCTVLSNFAVVNRPICCSSQRGQAATTEVVIDESNEGVVLGYFAPASLDWLPVLTLSPEERVTFHRLRIRLGAGEASCFAVAHHRGCASRQMIQTPDAMLSVRESPRDTGHSGAAGSQPRDNP